MNEGLGKVDVDKVSVSQQLQLEGELSTLESSIACLGDKLMPLMSPPRPEVAGGDTAKEEQQSPIMDHATRMTSKVRQLNGNVCHITQEIQV